MLNPAEGPATIAILGGNPVIGKALESLLRSADYVARFSPSIRRKTRSRSVEQGWRSSYPL